MRSPTLDANVQFMQEASQMKNSKHVKLKTFFDPCQTHLLYMISLNLSPLSTLCTLQTITYKKSIFYVVIGVGVLLGQKVEFSVKTVLYRLVVVAGGPVFSPGSSFGSQ